MKRILVLSDLHIGSGHKKGQVNLYDDFREDARFEELLAHYTRGRGRTSDDDELHVVLNGDIYDLLKVPVNGKFPDAITERLALMKVDQCLRGHPRIVKALSAVLADPKNRITFQPGNHDMEFFFPGVQRAFCRAVTGEELHPRLTFSVETPWFEDSGVQFHHGHQFEAIHAMDFKKLFLTRGQREPILNLPWGSLFILHVVNRMVNERPYLDKVMPFWPLFVGGMLMDTSFTLKMLGTTALTFARARLNPQWWQKRPFEKVTKFLRQDTGFFERLDHFARRIFQQQPHVHAIFMGHTHCEMVRTFKRGRVYVNTGSWMPMVNLNLSNLGRHLHTHYGLVQWNDAGEPHAALRRWHGHQELEEEVLF